MNHIEIYADGGTFGNSGSGFAVILLSLNHKWQRSFAAGNYSANLANLKAIEFGLLSVAGSFKNYPIKLFVRNKYARDMLEKDSDGYYKKMPRANTDAIEKVRAVLGNMNVEVVSEENENTKLCKKLVENAVKNNEPVDLRK